VVTNRGDAAGETTVPLRIDGTTVATDRVALAAGESREVVFVWAFDGTGDYELGIGTVPVGTISVERPATESPTLTHTSTMLTPDRGETSTRAGPAVEVVSAESVYSWVRSGFNASVRVTLANRGDRQVDQPVTVRVDGQRVASRTVSLTPGERKQVTVDFPAAEGTVTVNGVEAGAIRVGRAAEDALGTETVSPATGPGFGVGTAVILLVAAIGLAIARRADR
jgi:uncharacterized cupredoxin-like copper-binding protein